jgi:hypothetical protein
MEIPMAYRSSMTSAIKRWQKLRASEFQRKMLENILGIKQSDEQMKTNVTPDEFAKEILSSAENKDVETKEQ